jgi:hypothetical protein
MAHTASTCDARKLPTGSALLLFAGAFCSLFLANVSGAQPQAGDTKSPSAGNLVPLILKLPDAAFKGTPPNGIPTNSYTEPYDPDKIRPPMLVPAGLKNIAPAAKLTCSDTNIPPENLPKITDGDKEASEESVLVLRRGTQWVQMDFGAPHEIFAIVIWHSHNSIKVYHDVIVQAADDAGCTQNLNTLFNNDQDNSSGRGVGTDREYWETREGKLLDGKGIKARYLRFYSKGSTEAAFNDYTEIEVYGRLAK